MLGAKTPVVRQPLSAATNGRRLWMRCKRSILVKPMTIVRPTLLSAFRSRAGTALDFSMSVLRLSKRLTP
jgi:hypothetical protein